MNLDPTKTHLFHLTATEDVSPDLLDCLAYFVAATGCVIIVVGFCGCCGSLYERRNVLITVSCAFMSSSRVGRVNDKNNTLTELSDLEA